MRIDLSGKEYTKKYHPMDVKSCKIESVCACTGILFFLPLVSAPNSRYGRYWANQGLLVLFFEILCLIAWAISSALLNLLGAIPFIGIVFTVIKFAVAAFLIFLVLFYIVFPMSFAVKGRARDIPYFGMFRFIK